ncbi:hypothetical protein EON77_15530 [bacterium]|nr:MAG: hypothetical protein EON77_15530 [bacterium]
MPLVGTTWTLLHEERWYSTGETTIKSGDRLRISNPERATDVIQIDVEFTLFRFRFFTLDAPSLRSAESRLRLYDHDLLVAEHIVAWRDRDAAAGILARVETTLTGLTADAAAILLFYLVEHPLVSYAGRAPEPPHTLGF